MYAQLRNWLPGLVVLVGLGVVVKAAATVVPVNHLLIAVALGIVLANTVGVPATVQHGVKRYDVLLEVGIVLMGSYLVFGELLETGVRVFVLVTFVIVLTLLLVELLTCLVFGIESKLSTLLASGAAVCGVSAIVATAGGIEAEEKHVAYAVATVLVFDTLTLFTYPLAASVFGLEDKIFGVWAGISMFSTGPVTAAGFAHSDLAGTWATVTKLTRNTFLGVIVVGYSLYYARAAATTKQQTVLPALWENFPKFVVGFVFVIALASLEVLSPAQIASSQNASKWCFTFAFVGMGMQIRFSEMRNAGLRPFVAMLLSFLAISAISFVAVQVAFSY